MFPVLFRLGPLTIHTYGFLVAIGFLMALALAVRQGKKEGIPSNKIFDLGFYIILAALIGSRGFFILINYNYYLKNPLDIFKIWEGGLVFYGGLLFTIPTVIWYVRRNALGIWKTADILAPSIAIGHSFGRFGCFAAGCCYGKLSETLPWGIVFTDPDCLAPTNVLLHPVQLYEAGGEFINFVILLILRKRKSFNGQLFMTYLLLYAAIRFTIEFFRGDVSRGFLLPYLSVSQGISLLMFMTGLIGFFLLKRKRA